MSDGTETIVMPECEMPKTVGEKIREHIRFCSDELHHARQRFTLWDSLDQETKDKLDQIVGVKPI